MPFPGKDAKLAEKTTHVDPEGGFRPSFFPGDGGKLGGNVNPL